MKNRSPKFRNENETDFDDFGAEPSHRPNKPNKKSGKKHKTSEPAGRSAQNPEASQKQEASTSTQGKASKTPYVDKNKIRTARFLSKVLDGLCFLIKSGYSEANWTAINTHMKQLSPYLSLDEYHVLAHFWAMAYTGDLDVVGFETLISLMKSAHSVPAAEKDWPAIEATV